MCHLTTHICHLCGHTSYLPVLTRCTSLQCSIPVPCDGSVSIRSIKYHKGEYCIFCYHTALRKTENKYQKEIEALYAEAGEKGLSGRQVRRWEKLQRDRKWELDELSAEWMDRQIAEG